MHGVTRRTLHAVIIGAGSRGNAVFAELMATHDTGFAVAGVVEPDPVRRAAFVHRYETPADRTFDSLEAFLAAPRFADVVFICTPDRTHFEICREVSPHGYAVVLEKPVATTLADCMALLEVQQEHGNEIFVAHGLRYSPFFRKVRELIRGGELGALRHIHLTENVGHWHFAHSYVRGQWRRADQSAPIILTKTSHDLDILQWLVGEPVQAITCHGSLSYFRAENAPPGATFRCVDCPHQHDCLYSATRFYLDERPEWPYDVVLGGAPESREARRQAITTGPYGHCVWLNDNDVCDSQVVVLEYQSGLLATFAMHALTAENTRLLRVLCERGEITGNFRRSQLRVARFTGQKDVHDVQKVELEYFDDHHGGGDLHLLLSLHQHLTDGTDVDVLTPLRNAMISHVLAFLAEDSRLMGSVRVPVSAAMVPEHLTVLEAEPLPEPIDLPDGDGPEPPPGRG